MKKFAGYDDIQVNEGFKILPAGPYRCVIKKATEEARANSEGINLVILFDIAEGEHKGHFKDDFEKQTSSKKWRGIYRIGVPVDSSSEGQKKFFKRLITSIEHSNEGYKFDFDDKSLANMKDKKVGFVFREEEYEKEGKVKVAIKPWFARSWDGVLDEKVPERKKLQGTSSTGGSSWNPQTPTAPDDDDDMPF